MEIEFLIQFKYRYSSLNYNSPARQGSNRPITHSNGSSFCQNANELYRQFWRSFEAIWAKSDRLKNHEKLKKVFSQKRIRIAHERVEFAIFLEISTKQSIRSFVSNLLNDFIAQIPYKICSLNFVLTSTDRSVFVCLFFSHFSVQYTSINKEIHV